MFRSVVFDSQAGEEETGEREREREKERTERKDERMEREGRKMHCTRGWKVRTYT